MRASVWIPPTIDLVGFGMLAGFVGACVFIALIGVLDFLAHRRRRP